MIQQYLTDLMCEAESRRTLKLVYGLLAIFYFHFKLCSLLHLYHTGCLSLV